MLNHSRFQPLEAFASEVRFDSAEESKGLCLSGTLALGREARRLDLGSAVRFVRWRVVGDAEFLEHWALALDEGRVLDLTAIQVDGDAQHLRPMSRYPANYVDPRTYPAALVLDVMDGFSPPPGSRFPRALLWSLHRRLFCYDVMKAMRARSPRALVVAGTALARSAFMLSAGHMLELAMARMSRLLTRVD